MGQPGRRVFKVSLERTETVALRARPGLAVPPALKVLRVREERWGQPVLRVIRGLLDQGQDS